MKVAVDARELSYQPAGKGNYLLSILTAMMVEKDEALQLTLYFQEGGNPEDIKMLICQRSKCNPNSITTCVVRGKGIMWHRTVAKLALQQDVFFAALSYFSAFFNTIPTVTVVHDLAVFRVQGIMHNAKASFVERLLLKKMVKKSVAIIAVSEATAVDLRTYAPMAAAKTTVIPLAPALFDAKQALLPLNKRNGEVLFVGTLEPRKNITVLLKAYALLDEKVRIKHPLVLIGKKGWGDEDYQQQATQEGIAGQVQFLGYQEEKVILTHYHEAQVFIYPSVYEGFGLPVVEAMAAGTPVITSKTPALLEVGGASAISCTTDKPEEFARALQLLLEDTKEWEQHSDASLKRSADFSWEKSAMATKQLLQQR